MRLCHVFVDAPSTLEQLTCSREVAPFELDQPEVHLGFDEMRVVLQGEAEACVGGLELPLGQELDALVIQRDGFWGKGRAAGAAEVEQRHQAEAGGGANGHAAWVGSDAGRIAKKMRRKAQKLPHLHKLRPRPTRSLGRAQKSPRFSCTPGPA